jgi:outer membrane protein insertion porin family
MVYLSGTVRRSCALVAGRLALAVILAVAVSVSGARIAVAEGAVVIRSLDQVVVQGNQRIEAETIIAYVGATPGSAITADQVNTAVRRLYETELFRDVAITPQGGVMLVEVVENPSINRVVFEGNDDVSEEDLLGAVQSAPRQAYTRALGERDIRTIKELYARTGRYDAQVEVRAEEQPQNRVDVYFTIAEGERTGVGDIEFVGNEKISDRRLRGVIETSESGVLSWVFGGDVYDPDKLEFDKELLRRYYLQRGYADFRVVDATAELSEDREDFNITFVVEEGPVYTVGNVEVSAAFTGIDQDALMNQLTIGTGDTYNANEVDKSIDNLLFLAGQEGFAFTDVRPVAQKNTDDRTIDLVFEMEEGARVYIERIEIEGNSRTLDRVLRRQFKVAEGDAFNAREIRNATQRLRALGYFSSVEVTTERGSADDRAVIRVRVVEALTGSLSFGIGYGTDNGVQSDVTVSERNFLGRGQTLSARVAYAGNTQVFDFSFREPSFLDRDVAAGFRVFLRQEDFSDEASFEETNIGFRPSVEFPLTPNSTLEVAYIIASDEIRDVNVNASEVIAADEGTQITSAVAATYTYDQRNSKVAPTEGYIFTGTQELAGLGGDAYYSRTTGRVKGWTSFFEESVVASLELEAGGIIGLGSDNLVVADRFFIGGASLRGFARSGIGPRDLTTGDALGGNYFAVTRAEVSFPIGLPDELGIYGGLFADAGTLFGLDQTEYTTVTIDDSAQFRAAVGASLFIDSGFGPLQLSLAYPVVTVDGDEKQYFRFSAGTRF